MKTILKILGVIILLIVVYVVIAMIAFGSNYHYEKIDGYQSPKEKVWQQVSSMQAFNQWNPWMKLDPNMKITYSGNSGEVGDKYCWDSKMMKPERAVRNLKRLFRVKSKKQK